MDVNHEVNLNAGGLVNNVSRLVSIIAQNLVKYKGKSIEQEGSHSWSSAAVLKTAKGASSSWVRIPPLPQNLIKNMKNLYQTLKEIFQILSSCKDIKFDECSVQVSDSQIITPIGNVTPILFNQKSKLKNKMINLDLLRNLMSLLKTNNSIVRLNHIGFGYRVKSQQMEKQRLIKLTQKTNQYLYEEKSNDFGLWLFLGNTGKWEKPLIEFVPVEADHPQIDFFLPHIQIDIDTSLNSSEIEKIIKEIFNKTIKPYHVAVINGITCIVRCPLGIIDGVNIFIDLATNSRNVKNHRQNFLTKIS